jgi:hypothetical protein
MMKRRVPEVDRGVIAAERDLQAIALIEPENQPLDLGVEPGRGRIAGPGVGARGKADLAEERHTRRQLGCEVKRQLAEAEAARTFAAGRP